MEQSGRLLHEAQRTGSLRFLDLPVKIGFRNALSTLIMRIDTSIALTPPIVLNALGCFGSICCIRKNGIVKSLKY